MKAMTPALCDYNKIVDNIDHSSYDSLMNGLDSILGIIEKARIDKSYNSSKKQKGSRPKSLDIDEALNTADKLKQEISEISKKENIKKSPKNNITSDQLETNEEDLDIEKSDDEILNENDNINDADDEKENENEDNEEKQQSAKDLKPKNESKCCLLI